MSISLLLFVLATLASAAGCQLVLSNRRSSLDRSPDRGELRPRPPVTVVIPSFNEEGSIGWVLEQLPDWVEEVVLVDGLSNDATVSVAKSIRPDLVIVQERTRGKGAALRAGFAAASGEAIVMIDADGSTDPREMASFVDALRAGADFVKGSRHLPEGGSADLTVVRRLGNQFFVRLANTLFRTAFTDICYGYCAFWREHLSALALTADGFEIETELALGAVKAGLDIREVPSYELVRRAGVSKLSSRRDGVRVLRTMLTKRVQRGSGAVALRATTTTTATATASAKLD